MQSATLTTCCVYCGCECYNVRNLNRHEKSKHALAWAANRTTGSSSYIPPGPSHYFCTACDLILELSGRALHEQRSATHIEN
jgi:hypothetical protein